MKLQDITLPKKQVEIIWLLKSTVSTKKYILRDTGVCFALMVFSLHNSKLVSCSSESELREESVLQFPRNVMLIDSWGESELGG